MKLLILFSSFLLCFPAFADQDTKDGAAQDSTKTDSRYLEMMLFGIDFLPQQRSTIVISPPFEKKMGVLPAPNAKDVEPNGLIIKADPTVDLKMIFPKATRDKIVDERKKKWARPRLHGVE